MNKLILFTVFLILTLNAEITGQSDFGVNARVALSNTNKLQNNEVSKTLTSGMFGVYWQRKINKVVFIGAELDFNLIKWREDPSASIFITTNQYRETNLFHVGYLSLPVYMGLRINRVGIEVGIQPNFKIYETKTIQNPSEFNMTASNEINHYNVGPRFALNFYVTENVYFNVFYFHGRMNIQKNSTTKKIKQIGVGLNHVLNSK